MEQKHWGNKTNKKEALENDNGRNNINKPGKLARNDQRKVMKQRNHAQATLNQQYWLGSKGKKEEKKNKNKKHGKHTQQTNNNYRMN